jgi:hypothetical protein
MNRALRRAAASRARLPWQIIRTLPETPDAEPRHGGVFGRLDTGEYWSVQFPTTEEAQKFLRLLGPAPATKARLDDALSRIKGLANG